MRRRTTLGDRNLVGGNIIRIRAEKKMSQGELLSQIQLMGIDKLRFRRLRCAAIACHQYAVFGFHRVFDVAERTLNRVPSILSLADM